jgi:methyl-accepting chemotaxis protein
LDLVNRRLEGLDQVFDAKLKQDLLNIQKALADAKAGRENFEADVKKLTEPEFKQVKEELNKAKERLD